MNAAFYAPHVSHQIRQYRLGRKPQHLVARNERVVGQERMTGRIQTHLANREFFMRLHKGVHT